MSSLTAGKEHRGAGTDDSLQEHEGFRNVGEE